MEDGVDLTKNHNRIKHECHLVVARNSFVHFAIVLSFIKYKTARGMWMALSANTRLMWKYHLASNFICFQPNKNFHMRNVIIFETGEGAANQDFLPRPLGRLSLMPTGFFRHSPRLKNRFLYIYVGWMPLFDWPIKMHLFLVNIRKIVNRLQLFGTR